MGCGALRFAEHCQQHHVEIPGNHPIPPSFGDTPSSHPGNPSCPGISLVCRQRRIGAPRIIKPTAWPHVRAVARRTFIGLELPLTTFSEARRTPNEPAKPYLLTLAEILRRQAGAQPERLAILAPDLPSLSYAELYRHQQRAQARLRALGISRTDRVGLIVDNGPAAATAFFYIASAAACAPLNPAYKAKELEFYLGDIGARAIITSHPSTSPAYAAAARLGIPVFHLEIEGASCRFVSRAATAMGEETPDPYDVPDPDDLALLLHTSGTTSRPKLVPLLQRNLCASAAHIAATLALTPEDRCLNIMPLFHIHGLVAAVFSTLASGGSVVCTDGSYGSPFFERLREFRPSWYTAVPTMHMGILAKAPEYAAVVAACPLRFIRSSSAALPPQVFHALEAAFRAPVVEAYGMTEAAHQMACNPLPPRARKPGSVGPAAGPSIALMDAAGSLLAQGATGEVVIQGPNVTPGYLDNPGANAASFTNGWFRTGDQGWLDEDGYLHLTGRLKELINRGGEKISPREIDEVLLDHPSVMQALTFAVPHAQLGEEIAAAVVLAAGADASPAAIRDFAAARLAAFKVPRFIRILQEIPKGPTGKPQRIGLAARLGMETIDASQPSAEFRPPATALEEQICGIWREMLNAERIGTLDTFASLGGDSLQATHMLSAVAEATGANLPFLGFMEEGTVAAIAAEVEVHRASVNAASPSDPIVALRPVGARTPLVLLPGHDAVLLGLMQLARLLPEDQPVYALEGPAEERFPGAAWCVPSFANCYADALIARFGHQPLHLAGLCFGGVTAFELARQLSARGVPVQSLTLFDTLQPQWRQRQSLAGQWLASAGMYVQRTGAHLATLLSQPPRQSVQYLRERAAAFRRHRRDLGRIRAITIPAVAPSVPSVPCRTETALRRRHAATLYQPQPYAGRVLLVRVHGVRPAIPLLGWRPYLTGTVMLHTVPFSPRGLFAYPALPETAALMRQVLS